MSKPLKVLSKATLAAAFASSALIPTVTLAAEPTVEYTLDSLVLESDLKLYSATPSDFIEAEAEDFNMKVKYVKVNDLYYHVADFVEAEAEEGNVEGAAKSLIENYKPVDFEVEIAGSLAAGEDGWMYKDEQPEDRLNETFFYNVA